jgi:hypothetical protein
MREKYSFMMFENRALIGLFRSKIQKVVGETSPDNKLLKLKWRLTQNFSQKISRQDTNQGTCSCVELRIGGQVVGSCRRRNETLGPIKCGEFLD